jgi:hypothetical protein
VNLVGRCFNLLSQFWLGDCSADEQQAVQYFVLLRQPNNKALSREAKETLILSVT